MEVKLKRTVQYLASLKTFELVEEDAIRYFASEKLQDYDSNLSERDYIKNLVKYAKDTDNVVARDFQSDLDGLIGLLDRIKLLEIVNNHNPLTVEIKLKYTLRNHLFHQIANRKVDGELYSYLRIRQNTTISGIPYTIIWTVGQFPDTAIQIIHIKSYILEAYRILQNDDIYDGTSNAAEFMEEKVVRIIMDGIEATVELRNSLADVMTKYASIEKNDDDAIANGQISREEENTEEKLEKEKQKRIAQAIIYPERWKKSVVDNDAYKKLREEKNRIEQEMEKIRNKNFEKEQLEIQRERVNIEKVRNEKVREELVLMNKAEAKQYEEAESRRKRKKKELELENEIDYLRHESIKYEVRSALDKKLFYQFDENAHQIYKLVYEYDDYITKQMNEIERLKDKLQEYENSGLDKYIDQKTMKSVKIEDFTEYYTAMKRREFHQMFTLIYIFYSIIVHKSGKEVPHTLREISVGDYKNIPSDLYDLTIDEATTLENLPSTTTTIITTTTTTTTTHKSTYLSSSSSEFIGKISLGNKLIHRSNYEEIVKGGDATGAEQFTVEFSDKTGIVRHKTTISEIALFPGSCGDEIKSIYILDFRNIDSAFNVQQSVRMNEGSRMIPSNGNLSLTMASMNGSSDFSFTVSYSIELMPDERIQGIECVYEIRNGMRLYTTLVDNNLQQLDMIILSSTIIASSFRTPPPVTPVLKTIRPVVGKTTTTTTIPIVATTNTTGIQSKNKEETKKTGVAEPERLVQSGGGGEEEDHVFQGGSTGSIFDMRKTLMESLTTNLIGEAVSGVIIASGDDEGD